MRVLRYLVPIALLIGLVVASIGWYRTATTSGSGNRFESCQLEGSNDVLVLKYLYGANQRVSVSLDTTKADVAVVGLHIREGSGATPAIGLNGEARLPLFGSPSTFRYDDGRKLTCSRQ